MKRVERSNDLNLIFGEGVEIGLKQAVETFLRVERAAASWSKDTESWYRDRLLLLALDLGTEKPVSSLMEGDLAAWRVRLSEKDSRYGISRPEIRGGLSPYTLHGHVRAARRFLAWLSKSGILPVDLSKGIKLPKLPRQQKRGISDENALAILDAAKSSGRDYALITFIESTGARRGGAENLRLGDLSLDVAQERLRRRALVREKGEKERPVLMSETAYQAMRAWLLERPAIDDDHVFLGCSPGQAWHALTDVGISEVFDRYKKQLDLKGPCSPHQWRHRWCRRLLQNGMPLVQVSQLAGHTDIKVTHDFYSGFDFNALQDSYERFYRE